MLSAARLRALAYANIRTFFAERNVLEVETPLLSQGASHDCHIDVFPVPQSSPNIGRFLQTSPEPHMKRLLALGYPDIYQLCKAFRLGDRGDRHNPEFTLLEWYRRDFTLRQMEEETVAVCRLVTGNSKTARHSYREIFSAATGMDPLAAPREQLVSHPVFGRRGLSPDSFPERGDALNFLMSEVVEPTLDPSAVTVIHGYPAELSSQAMLDPDCPGTALRFEVFAGGMELGNGYRELSDPKEYRSRFETENRKRQALGKPTIPLHADFFGDLGAGLPACSGVALGIDRLLLYGMGQSRIEAVLEFPWERA